MNDRLIAIISSIAIGAGSILFSSINESRVIHVKSQAGIISNDRSGVIYTISNSSSTLSIKNLKVNFSCDIVECLPSEKINIDLGRNIGFFVTPVEVISTSALSYTASMNLAAGAVVQFGIPKVKGVDPPKLAFEVDYEETSRLMITESDWLAFLASRFYELIAMAFFAGGILLVLFVAYRLMLMWGARHEKQN